MTSGARRLAVCALAIVACSCSQRPAKPIDRAAQPPPAALPTLDERPEVATRGGVTTSTGTGTAADFEAIDMPLYPGMRPQDSFVVKKSGAHVFDMTLQASVPQDLERVQDWYVRRLGATYKVHRVRALGDSIVTFARNVAGDRRSVLLQRESNSATELPVTVLTIDVTKRR